MPWFKVDDTFPHHAKVLAAGNSAVGLWTRAGAWSMQQLTDGFIPTHVARTMGTPADARRLVEVGLWLAEEGGYRFHQWDERQPSREKVEAERHAATERQRRAREAAKLRRESRRDTAVSHGPPDPTRPDPHVSPNGETTPKSLALVPAEERPDVDRICTHLVERIVSNGGKRPTITKGWRDSARLMLDRDNRPEHEIHGAIDWCQDDEFWRANVLSLPKLREKFDTLRLQAQRRGTGGGRQQAQNDHLARAMARAEARERDGA